MRERKEEKRKGIEWEGMWGKKKKLCRKKQKRYVLAKRK